MIRIKFVQFITLKYMLFVCDIHVQLHILSVEISVGSLGKTLWKDLPLTIKNRHFLLLFLFK